MNICVLTGAGISAESGLPTFRGSGGLWENHSVFELATPEAWARDPGQVLRFYTMRRELVRKAEPNAAHRALARLQEVHEVRIITQNIDDLHERAGSRQVLHLHGEIMKGRSTSHPDLLYDLEGKDIALGDTCERGSQLRPHVVWFGEPVTAISEAVDCVSGAEVLIVIGTSLTVYPAAGLVDCTPLSTRILFINPEVPERVSGRQVEIIASAASMAVPPLVARLCEDR